VQTLPAADEDTSPEGAMLGLSLFALDAKHIIVYVIILLAIIAIVWYAMARSARV
jgi:hypothetical protein